MGSGDGADRRQGGALRIGGRLYPFPSLATGLPETVIDLFADWARFAARFDRVVGEIEQGRRRPMWIDEAEAEILAPLLYPGKILAPAPTTTITWPRWVCRM